MLRFSLALLLLVHNYTWAEDNMANITAGEYRPLYLSVDSPIVNVSSFRLDKKPVTNSEFQAFVSQQKNGNVMPHLASLLKRPI